MLQKKYILLVLLAVFGISFAAEDVATTSAVDLATISNEQTNFLSPITRPVTPESTILLFDINDVLFKKSIPQIVGRSLWTVFPRLGFWQVMWPSFWTKVKELNRETNCKEHVFVQLLKLYPALKGYESDYLGLSTSHNIIPEMIEIVKNLKAQGYKLYLFSNMGIRTVYAMALKFPEVFELFDGRYVPCDENNYNYKPLQSFYQELNNYLVLQADGDKQKIFIDDRKENLEEALRNGIAGILCTSTEAVKTKLQELHALTEEL